MANDTQRPSDLVPVNPNGYVNIETTAGAKQESGRPDDLIQVDPDYVSKQVNPNNAVTGVAAGAAAMRPLLEKTVGLDATGRRSMEQYLRNQISHKYPGLDLSSLEKELRSVTHPKERVATMHEIQEALKTVEGRGIPGVGPVDLTGYETAPKPTTMVGKATQPLKKVGEYVENLNPFTGSGMGSKAFRTAGRGGLGYGAGYEGAQAYNKLVEGDVAGAVPHASSALGYGALLSTNPKVKGAGALLAGTPLVGKLIGNAEAAPMSREEASGTAFDVASGLLGPAALALTPSELGAGTLQPKREVYRPGMNVLRGSTLPPEQRAQGGLVYLAKGGEPKKPRASIAGTLNEVGTVQGPSLASIWSEHLASLPETTEKNLRHQQDVMNRAMPFDPKTGQLLMGSDPAAMNELAEMVSGVGGITKAVKGFVPRATNILKASEALGAHEGKKLGLTQTDNFGVHGGRMGGNRFPDFQNTSPIHQRDQVVWMNDSEKHARDMVNRGGEDTIWSTYIGAPDQLKSNKSVFNDILQQHYARNLTPEQIDLINQRIAVLPKDKKKGTLMFPQSFDIRDKFATAELGGDTFDRRAALAEILGEGKGVKGTKAGIAMPEYQDILRSHRDPLTEGVPTSSVGTRLFTVDPNIPTKFSQEYHPDYNWTVHGKDTGVQFEKPVPQSLAVPDWYNEINARAPGKTHGNAWFSYMKNPQVITEEMLTRMQKEGYADGGSVIPSVSLDIQSMPNMTGQPGVGYMQAPQGTMARMQMEKELANAKLRAGVSGVGMALPGQQGVKMMPGQMDIGAKIPMGRGSLDISANRSINPIPGRGHEQGVNARYTMPFKKGGLV